jgi:peptidoglycan/LPS O-acetylase OafA/YrhL
MSQMLNSKVVSIQYLRGCAASLVVFHHALDQFPSFHALLPINVGASGVDIFFVISGFVMTYTNRGKETGAGEFLRRRIVRIVPLYWIITTITAVLLILAPAAFRHSKFTWDHFLMSLLFVPHENPGLPGSLSPMMKLGWTLNFEMLFYALFALFIGLSDIRRTIVISMSLVLLILVATVISPGPAPLRFWGNAVVLEFVLGCTVALLYNANFARTIRPSLWLVLAAGAAISLVYFSLADSTLNRLLAAGVPATVLVAACLGLEAQSAKPWNSKFLLLLGDASYSIYLAHLYVVIALRLLWEKAAMPTSGYIPMLVFVSACLVIGVTAGCLTYFLVELPATRWARTKLRSKKFGPAHIQ